jgi:hypothetical protein
MNGVRWRFFIFRPREAKTNVADVIRRLGPEHRAKFDFRLKCLRDQPIERWESPSKSPYAKRLNNGVWEIRYKAENIQQRPLGGVTAKAQFALVFWATEKGGRFIPPNAVERAAELLSQARNLRGDLHEYLL